MEQLVLGAFDVYASLSICRIYIWMHLHNMQP